MDKIAVIMSTYRETEKHLKKAIESILNQTYANFEFIIILDDPANTDNEKIIKEYASTDSRIVFSKNDKNMGLTFSLNKGMSMTKCEIIARMDADDVSEPQRLEKELQFLKDHQEYSVVSVNYIAIDMEDNVLSHGGRLPVNYEITKRTMRYFNMVLHPGVMFYKDDIVNIGGYRQLVPNEDYDLWLRVLTSNKKIGFLDEELLKYRMQDNSISSKNALKQWHGDKYVKKMYKERIKVGYDSYSDNSFKEYLLDKKCDEKGNIDRFNDAWLLFRRARMECKNAKYLQALRTLYCSIRAHREMIPFIVNLITGKIIFFMSCKIYKGENLHDT